MELDSVPNHMEFCFKLTIIPWTGQRGVKVDAEVDLGDQNQQRTSLNLSLVRFARILVNRRQNDFEDFMIV